MPCLSSGANRRQGKPCLYDETNASQIMHKAKMSILSGLAFGLFVFLFVFLLVDVKIALRIGLTAGAGFAVFMYGFSSSPAIAAQTALTPEQDTGDLLFEMPANHVYKGEGTGGRLYLFADRLYYKSHQKNINNHETTIPLRDIREVKPHNYAGIISTGMWVTLRDGTKEKFIVGNRKEWLARINSLIKT